MLVTRGVWDRAIALGSGQNGDGIPGEKLRRFIPHLQCCSPFPCINSPVRGLTFGIVLEPAVPAFAFELDFCVGVEVGYMTLFEEYSATIRGAQARGAR